MGGLNSTSGLHETLSEMLKWSSTPLGERSLLGSLVLRIPLFHNLDLLSAWGDLRPSQEPPQTLQVPQNSPLLLEMEAKGSFHQAKQPSHNTALISQL